MAAGVGLVFRWLKNFLAYATDGWITRGCHDHWGLEGNRPGRDHCKGMGGGNGETALFRSGEFHKHRLPRRQGFSGNNDLKRERDVQERRCQNVSGVDGPYLPTFQKCNLDMGVD